MPLPKDVDVGQLARMAAGYSAADVEALCREAGLNALRRDTEASEVTLGDFRDKIKPSITADMHTWYQNFSKRSRVSRTQEMRI